MPLESYYDEKWFKNRLEKITEDTEFTEEFSTQVEFLIDCYLSDILTDVADLAERGGEKATVPTSRFPVTISMRTGTGTV